MAEGEPTTTGTGPAVSPGTTFLDGRFRCDRLIKSGNGVETYAATDLVGGRRVILKRVLAAGVDDSVRLRLVHEAEVLSHLKGLSFRSPVGVAHDGDYMYLVKPYIPGATLEQRLANGPLSLPSTLRVAIDVLTSLEQVHENGILHRDVKPANVIIDLREPVERAVLIDFGFARSNALAPSLRDERVGTARYLAPEAAGTVAGSVDARSDLYAVGVVMFECLAGRPPFAGGDVGAVLREHLNTPAPQLRALGIEVPRALDAVIQRLLRKDPGERYQSAGAVIDDLEEIAEATARGETDPVVVIGLHDRRQVLTEPSFVGRTAELERLEQVIRNAGRGRGGLVKLEAESGGGKTRLLEELAQQTRRDAWILRGQAMDQAAQRPFQLLEGVVEEILAVSQEVPLTGEMIRERLGEHAEAVVAALPALGQLLGGADASGLGPEAYGETRSISALSALLDSLGSGGRPAVVILDDCQWADGPTLKLLTSWQRSVLRQGSNVVVVAAFRTEEVGPGHLLRSVKPAAAIALPPFRDQDVKALVESMAGPLPPLALETITSLSEGSPFMAAAVLRGLVEVGALVDAPTGWQVDEDRMVRAQTSRRAALFLVRRLELLPPDTLSLLSAGAVLGKEFSLDLAAQLAGQQPEETRKALAHAVRRRIVWSEDGGTGDPGGASVSFLHDKLREALLSRMDPAERSGQHGRAAELIEALDSGRVFELAYHFDSAGRGDRALPYALSAAAVARRQYSLDVAAAHYEMAMRAVGKGDLKTRAVVAEGLGDVLTLQGRYEDAVEALVQARALAGTDYQRASIEGKLGDVAFKRGDQGLARTHLESALRELRRRLPRRKAGFLIALLFELLVQALHTLLPRLFVGRRRLAGGEKERREFLAIRTYSRLAYVYWFSRGRVPCAWAHLREMNLVERYEPTPELAQAYSEHAPVMTMVPWVSRGVKYAERSLAIRRDQGDVWGQGQSLHFYGVVLFAASRYRECIAKCEEAVRLLNRTGDRWEMNTASWHIAFCLYRLGDLAGAIDAARRVHEAAAEIKDDAAAGITLDIWSRASGGEVPAELVEEHLGRRNDDAQTTVDILTGEAIRLIRRGELVRAVETCEQAATIVRSAGLRQAYIAAVYPWLATARRLQIEATASYAVAERRRLVRHARKASRRAWRVARYYRGDAPHALRERGLIQALRGRGRAARRLLDHSLAEADAQDARYEYTLSLQAWGMAGRALGWPGAEDSLRRAEEKLAVIAGESETESDAKRDLPSLSLIDRFSTLLEMGRAIASAPSRREVYEAVREAAATLLRGERCQVFELDENAQPSWSALYSEQTSSPSKTLIRKAIERGRPVLMTDADLGDSTDSVVLADVRSALCSPIFCEGRAVACLYVAHTQVSSLFGADEVRLIEFITTLAGAALDHVAGTEARFRSLAQNSSDVITIVDRHGIIGYQSAAVTRVFGFAAVDLVGSPLADWVHPDDVGTVLEVLESSANQSEQSRRFECRLRHHDGSWRDVETSLSNLLEEPNVTGLVLNSRDITDRKRAERELRDMLEREHEMRESLQELDRIKTDFVSSVSHELRTPLSSILGYVEILNEDRTSLDGDQARVLTVVERNARRLLALIEDLLTISRVESGTFRLALGPVDLAVLIDTAHQSVLPELASRKLKFELDVDPGIGTIVGDAVQLDRVLMNLLTNAIKFTPNGGRISLAAHRAAGEIVLRVTDTGIGIPVDEQPRLFERFFRSSSAQQMAVPGTGLGLSITKKVIDEHGGDIRVESEPGKGTAITVRLPFTARRPNRAAA